MGCISSKVMSRAVSFQEDRLNRHRSQTKSNGMPLLQELMFTSTSTSANGGVTTDQFLALLCTTNKLRTGTVPNPATEVHHPPPPNTDTIDTWDLMAGLEEQALVQQQQQQQQPQEAVMSTTLDDVLKKSKRSKSCQWLPDDQVSDVPGIELLNEDDEFNNFGKRGTIVRSRSFHTVEEYDALLEKIWLYSRANETVLDDYNHDGSSTQPFESPILEKSQRANHNDVDIQETAKSSWLLDKQHQLLLRLRGRERDSTVTEEGIANPCLDSSSIIEESTSSNFKDEDVPLPPERRECEKGLKRRAIAKGLESLKIPPSIEFPTPTVTNIRKWVLVGGQVYSPGSTYVTPKFGSYNNNNTSSSSSGRLGKEYCCTEEDGALLNPELVAAFEECMQQLQVEEESLLKQIEANATVDKQAQEDNINAD